MTNGKLEIFHVRQHGNMSILSPNWCIQRRFLFAFAVARLEFLAEGLLKLHSSCFPLGNVLLFALSHKVQSRRAILLDDGILFEDGVSDLFEGFPNGFLIVSSFPSRSHCPVSYG